MMFNKKTINLALSRRHIRGFSLVELMVILLIIGVLASVAYPRYLTQLQSTQRAVAQSALVSLSATMEIYYSENNSYKGASLPEIFPNKVPLQGAKTTYQLSLTIASDGASYNLMATPINSELNKQELSSTGLRKDGNKVGWLN